MPALSSRGADRKQRHKLNAPAMPSTPNGRLTNLRDTMKNIKVNNLIRSIINYWAIPINKLIYAINEQTQYEIISSNEGYTWKWGWAKSKNFTSKDLADIDWHSQIEKEDFSIISWKDDGVLKILTKYRQ